MKNRVIKPARTAHEFVVRYAVDDPEKMAVAVLNPLTDAVRAFAEAEGERLAASLGRGVRAVVGGSLGYGALMKDNYDIDLRLLLPKGATREKIDAAVVALVEREGFANPRFIDEGGTNYIWHLKKLVHVPALKKHGDPEVELTINVQSGQKYAGLAATSALMPREVILRYVVAKAMSKAESPDCYKALKEYWKVFVKWAQARGYDKMTVAHRGKLLKSSRALFPLFLQGPNQ